MTSLIEQIEEMRVRMNDLATGEQDLVRALGEALGRADQKLLQDVRAVAQEHEQRRGVILKELQGLAQRMGALPRPRAPFAVLEEPVQELPARRRRRSSPQRTCSAAATGARPPPTSTTSWQSRSAPARPRASSRHPGAASAPQGARRGRPGPMHLSRRAGYRPSCRRHVFDMTPV